ncbi:hypothetical protein ACTTAI_16485 [Rhodobacter capsulatus]|uniref:hypothetical protein n=1 Tax=Rhodobacter capsulatus TaxID=1061 RepID=UPI0040253A95
MKDSLDPGVEIRFDAGFISKDAIKKALYRHGDVVTFEVSILANELCVALRLRSDAPAGVDLEIVAEQLRLDAVDYDLRERIAEQTAPLRNTILAYTFSRTGLMS